MKKRQYFVTIKKPKLKAWEQANCLPNYAIIGMRINFVWLDSVNYFKIGSKQLALKAAAQCSKINPYWEYDIRESFDEETNL